MSFDHRVQQWIQMDNQLKKLNEQVKHLREQRHSLELSLSSYAKTNNMADTTIKVNNDKLKFVETKVPEPLTFKYLEKSLREIIANDAQVQLILDHVKQKRSVKLVPEIKRFSLN